ncbi:MULTISPECIES: GLPGLI family protein [Amniculibacterium]|jgi:GLPGLI family protein|uniref:GLPGLI family protein n=1 Tax=Amniculibacterium TaxID=2715289 RepID=UPI000F598195|nr:MULTISPECIES: GLPGLI family protein [Amniculibacterium]
MKRILGFFTILVSCLTLAQSHRFYYELTFKPHKDSAKVQKEVMSLDIDKNKSIYQAYQMVQMDSLLEVSIENMKKTGVMMDTKQFENQKKGSFAHRISKNNPIKEILYSDFLGTDSYSYKEQPNFNWKITSDKSKIGEYNAQKASTEYGGRKWTAWFSTDLPFQDGPYKFYGLPGLIVKIEDEGKNYSWELKGNKQIKKIADELYFQSMMKQSPIGNKTMEVSKEKFNEKYEAYKKDPLASVRQMLTQLPPEAQVQISGAGGQSVSQMMRDAEKQMKEELARVNNSIEIPVVKTK